MPRCMRALFLAKMLGLWLLLLLYAESVCVHLAVPNSPKLYRIVFNMLNGL